jgi:hypothetical protein
MHNRYASGLESSGQSGWSEGWLLRASAEREHPPVDDYAASGEVARLSRRFAAPKSTVLKVE